MSQRIDRSRFFGIVQVSGGHSNQFAGIVARDFAKPLVDLQKAPVKSHFRSADRGILKECAIMRLSFADRGLALAQGRFDTLLVGHVEV
jgi:hypothetical protein